MFLNRPEYRIGMKKIIYLILSVFICLPSCRKDPDLSKLDSEFVVFTDYDNSVDFGSYTSYYIPDSVLIVSEKEPRYWEGNDPDQIIHTFINQMNIRGYTRTTVKEEADLGIQVSYIEDVNYFYDYYTHPSWWWGYPGYWSPGYWGGWGGWYYPYPIRYSFSVGSLLTEMIDLNAKTPRIENSLPVIWTSYMTGLVSSSNRVDVPRSIRAVDQAFAQSPYITKTLN